MYIQGTVSKTKGGLDLPLFVSWDLPLRLLGCLGHRNAMICEQRGRDTSAIYVFEIFPFCLSLQLSLGF